MISQLLFTSQFYINTSSFFFCALEEEKRLGSLLGKRLRSALVTEGLLMVPF